jgi:L-threonylcarbamoyladenylate synthase
MTFLFPCRFAALSIGERQRGSRMATIMTPSAAGIARAVATLAAGDIAALPTETVYGLAADAANGLAVAKIYAAKGRPSFNPLICHVSGLDMARLYGDFDAVSERLAKAFWPGPLTLVVPLRENSSIHPLVTAGLPTIALRAPRGVVSEIITLLGRPIAAPSANTSGRISATAAQAVSDDLGAAVPLVLDGGPSPVGLESTILKVENGKMRLLRPGGVPAQEIENVLGMKLIRGQGEGIEAPGMLESHYAPKAALRLNIDRIFPGEALLAFGPVRAAGAANSSRMLNLSEAGDLTEAAANLFAHLLALDKGGAATIAVEPVPMRGLGEAINDRLARAAAPRGQ